MEKDNNQKPPAQESGGQPQHIVVEHKTSSSAVGICALVFGVISIFFLTVLFAPLALIMAIIAFVKKQIGWAIGAVICAIIGMLTSPIFLGLLGIAAAS